MEVSRVLEGAPAPGAPGDGASSVVPQAAGFDVALLLAALVGRLASPDAGTAAAAPPPPDPGDPPSTDTAAAAEASALAGSALVVATVPPAVEPPSAVKGATAEAATPAAAAQAASEHPPADVEKNGEHQRAGVQKGAQKAEQKGEVDPPSVRFATVPDSTPPAPVAAAGEAPPSVAPVTDRVQAVEATPAGPPKTTGPSTDPSTHPASAARVSSPDPIPPPEAVSVVAEEVVVAAPAAAKGKAAAAAEGGPRGPGNPPLEVGAPAAPHAKGELHQQHAPSRPAETAPAPPAPDPDGVARDGGDRRQPGHGASDQELPRAAAGSEPPAPSPLSPPAAREVDRTLRAHEPPAPEPATPRIPDAVHQIERLVRLDELRPRPLHDGGDMRLELSPDGLGRIEVHVTVRDDGVQANLLAQHDHAREALELHRPALEAALGRSSLRLEGFTVGLGEHPQGEPGATPQERRLPAAETRPSEPAAPLPGASRLGGLSLRA